MDFDHILKVSERHFFAKRYSDVKLDNIANELNIKKPSLYYYFKDKKDLFLETLKFSMNNYIKDLKIIIENNDFNEFVNWYLKYPTDKLNLFAIALQKGYCVDPQINNIIFKGKQTVNQLIKEFLKNFGISNVRVYLIINLLDKLSQDNCIEGYCLSYKIEDIIEEIKVLLKC